MKLSEEDIIYEDNHLLVIDKPRGWLTLPEGGVKDSALWAARDYLKEKYQKSGNVFLHQVHRLDRVASGILVFAKTSKALTRLNQQIREGDWEKEYLVRCEHLPKIPEGELVNQIRKGHHRAHIVEKGGKEARLYYCVREDGMIVVQLYTGRYHQIRAQLAAIGCPICGDQKYGAKQRKGKEGIDLHHYRLQLTHPVTHKRLHLVATRNALTL